MLLFIASSRGEEELLSRIAPQSRLKFFVNQRPQSFLCHTLNYNEILQSGLWICDICLNKHLNKTFDCRVGYRHAAVGNASFPPSLCAICHTFMDVYLIQSACIDCSLFFKDYFINLLTAEFIRVYYGNATIIKRWLDCKFYKILNPCDKPLII